MSVTLIFGLVYFFFSFVSLFFHFIVGMTLTRSPKFRKHIALRMMLFLSVSDGLQLVIHMFSGVLSIFELEIDYTFNTIIGFIAMTLWNATIFQQTVLAVNRLYVLSRPKVIITRAFHINLLIGFSWVCALLLHIAYVSMGEVFWFSPQVINWLETVPHTPFFFVCRYLKITLLSIGLLSGLVMLVIVLWQHYSTNPGKSRNKIQPSMEIRLFIQSCCSPALGLFNVIVWACCNIPVNKDGLVISGLLNFEWILINAIQPYLGLIFSRKLRIAALEQLRLKRRIVITSSAIPKWSKIRQLRSIAPIMHREGEVKIVSEHPKI